MLKTPNPKLEHIAIMRKSWRLTQKILSSQKTLESRWLLLRCRPWNCVKKGENIYFQDSGEPVSIKAKVSKVIQFDGLTPSKVRKLLYKYGNSDGIEKNRIPEFFKRFKDKKYCILIFLDNPQRVKPFKIDKTGFGAMSAWITVNNISRIKY